MDCVQPNSISSAAILADSEGQPQQSDPGRLWKNNIPNQFAVTNSIWACRELASEGGPICCFNYDL